MSKQNADARPKKRPGNRRLITEGEVAEILGIDPMTLRIARSKGRGEFATLRWFKFGPHRSSTVRYDADFLMDVWLPRYLRSHGELDAA
jgi:hypothetical protein